MTDDLGAILEYVDALRALDTAAVEPMTHAVPFDCPTRRRRGEAVAAGRRGAGERPPPRRQLLPGSTNRPRSGRRRRRCEVVSASIDARGATAVAIADGVRAGKWRARDVAEQYLDRIARLDGALGCYLLVDADGRAPARRRGRRRAARRDATRARSPACRSRSRTSSCTRGVETTCASKILRGLRPALRGDGDGAPRGGGRGDARQAEHGRVRDGLVEREQRVQAGAQPVVARRTCRAARRAARRRRWRRRCARARSAPTRAARSASRRRCAASSASSRPTGASRATASSRSRRRSITRGRSRAPSRTRRRCSR